MIRSELDSKSASHSISKSLAVSFFCAGLLAATTLWSLTIPPGLLDDPIQLTGAMLWLRGQTPNVDFYSVYPPLNTYLIGTAFRIFGESVVSYRIVQTAAYLVIVCALGAFAFRRQQRHARLLLLGAILLSARLADLQTITALMWFTLSLASLLEARSSHRAVSHYWLVASGLALGALALTRLNFSLYLAGAWFVDAVLHLRGPDRHRLRDATREAAWLATPAMAIAALVLVLWGGSLYELVHQIAIVPSKALVTYAFAPVARQLSRASILQVLLSGLLVVPLPVAWLAIRARAAGARQLAIVLWAVSAALLLATLGMGCWIPAALPSLALLLIAGAVLARVRLSWLARDEWFVLLLLCIQLHYTLSRPDGSHFYTLFPTLIMLAICASADDGGGAWRRLLVVIAVLCGPAALYNLLNISRELVARRGSVPALGTLLRTNDQALYKQCGSECDTFRADRSELDAAEYVRAHTTSRDFVFSGLLHHGRIEFNDMRAYWLMRRPAGTHHIMMMRGVSTSPADEAEIVADLVERRVRWLLLWAPDPQMLPVEEQPTLLDPFIREHFELAKRFGSYEVWRVKRSGSPDR